MAEMFITQMEGDFDPGEFTDSYREALEEVVQAKLSGVAVAEADEGTTSSAGGEVVDLVAALRASVEAAKAKRKQAAGEQEPAADKPDKKTTRKKAS